MTCFSLNCYSERWRGFRVHEAERFKLSEERDEMDGNFSKILSFDDEK